MRYFRLLFCCLFQLTACLLPGQHFQNLDFEQACDTSKTGLCHWDLSWGGRGACAQECPDGNGCLRIQGKVEQSVGFAEQSLPVPPDKGLRILQIQARVSTEAVEGKGAGLNVGMYDAEGNLVATRDMGGFYSLDWVRGTCAWRTIGVSAVCPAETATIKLGAILYGKGLARFDDYAVQITPLGGRKPSRLARRYVGAACDSIARHSLLQDSLDMPALRKMALQIAGPARTGADCHLAVQFLLESLRPFGDHHSFFMTPAEVRHWAGDDTPAAGIQLPRAERLQDCGYLFVPPFHSGNTALMQAYADSLQAAIRRLDTAGIRGWIVDLRENTGGNMEPMIAGLGPLFDTVQLGALYDVRNQPAPWGYRAGTYVSGGAAGVRVAHPVVLSVRRPIAVLTSPHTGSSGEIVALSFVGNGHTRSFGQATWGLTTGNGGFDLPDGARMMLASTVMADRTGRKYTGPVLPDVVVEPGKGGGDAVLDAAARWILGGR